MRRWEVSSVPSVSIPEQTLSADELTRARNAWIRLVQRVAFRVEIEAASDGCAAPPRSPLCRLNPFLDKRGLLKVEGA